MNQTAAAARIPVALAMLGLAEVGQLAQFCEACLLDLPLVGRATIAEISGQLSAQGLALASYPCARDRRNRG